MKLFIITFGAALTIALTVVTSHAQYTATLLGPIESQSLYTISSNGLAAGAYTVSESQRHPLVYDPATQESLDLGTLGGPTGWAKSLNTTRVVGAAQTSTSALHGFGWVNGYPLVDFGVLPGGTWSEARSISPANHTVGWGNMSDNRAHGWYRQRKLLKPLPDLGGPQTIATDVNSHAQIVGMGEDAFGAWHILFWPDVTTVIDLGLGFGYANNDLGIIACSTYLADGSLWPCRYNAVDGFEILPQLPGYTQCEATSIDPTGLMGGHCNECADGSTNHCATPRAALWDQAGNVYDLTNLISNRDQWDGLAFYMNSVFSMQPNTILGSAFSPIGHNTLLRKE
jgi:probable HAF family extracellular repeat protein